MMIRDVWALGRFKFASGEIVTVCPCGDGRSARIRTWAGSFDSSYEWDYWLWACQSDEVASIVRNTSRLRFTEPVTYTANGVEHTVGACIPDFFVFAPDGSCRIVEVKGWVKERDKATAYGLARDYPQLSVATVMRGDLLAIQQECGDRIEGWVKIK